MQEFEEQDYTKGFELGLWKKLVAFALKHRKAVILLLTFNTILAVLERLAPLFDRYAIDTFIETGDFSTMPMFIGVYALLIAAQVFCVFNFVDNAGNIEVSVVRDIRAAGFKRLQELSFSYFDTTHVGWIMARMTSDAQRIGDFISWGMFDLVMGSFSVIIAATIMLVLNWKLALVVMAVMPILATVSYQFQKRILKRFRESRKINSKITASYNEGINGAKTTKTLVREEKNFADFKSLSVSMKKASLRAILLTSLHFPVVMVLASFGPGALVWVGGIDVLNTVISVGTFSAFISYAFSMMDPIMQIASIISEMQSAQASGERTMTLLETQPDITDRPDVLAKYGDALNPKPENWEDITGDIEFKNVSFSYKTGEQVLKNFNLKVRAGEKIALVGETGSGKSTIVNLVCRFYEPTEGDLLIDGVDYRERSQIWLQSRLGYVLQAPHLFSGTIMENIRYSNLEATNEEVIEAAKLVNAYDFIMKFEKGFNTDVGEGGNRLSSGEKQLVSFARAILGKSKIFVLDEATASIDTETEQEIQKAIEQVLVGKTSFIVAHRLSTIRSCDRILVISDGEILEEGSHKQLIKQRGHYYKLYTNQFKEEAESRVLGIASEMPGMA